MDAHPHRLSHVVRPIRYDIEIEPDLDEFAFRGAEEVRVVIASPLDTIVLNAAHLEIDWVRLRHDDGTVIEATSSLDADSERLFVHLAEQVAAGEWVLECEFRGEINDRLEGFYRSTYEDPEGEEQVIATTQFEATYARQAFPCWDQPDLKAAFGITLIVPEDLAAISNSPIEHEERRLGNRIVRFKDTMVMSTYLVAYIIGRFEATEPVDVDGVPLQVWHLPGKGHLAEYALESGVFALRYLSNFYGIPYPGDKVDMIGIPDFSWGAMENLGAITYRETALLVDKQRASQADLARVADVVAHELAHMWFGDLVTMKWWNGIWLNEAFATFMELKCVDAFRPDWKRFLSFATEGPSGRSISMDIDALEATRPIEYDVDNPDDANGMFDALTYGKGAAVLRMLEQYLGEEPFRQGVKLYLERHAHGNAETDDLWHALEEVTGEEIAPMMNTWIRQGGHPLVEVAAADGGGTRLRQRHFQFAGDGGNGWHIPVLYRTPESPDGAIALESEAIVSADPFGLIVNAGGHGFYRVRYAPKLFEVLVNEVQTLEPLERYGLVADSWALVLSGDEPAGTFLDLVGRLGDEPEPVVWEAVAAGLGELDRIAKPSDREAFRGHVRQLAGPALRHIGWEPAAGESDLDKRKRAVLVGMMGIIARDQDTIAKARRLRRLSLQGETVEPALAHACLGVAAANGTVDDYEAFIEEWRTAPTPQDVVRNLAAAAAVPQVEAARRTIEMVVSGDIRSQDAHWVLGRLLGHRSIGVEAWEMWKERWDELVSAVPPSLHRRMLDAVPSRSEPETAADIERFLTEHRLPTVGQYLEQQIERLRVRVALRQREEEKLGGYLRRSG